MKTYKVTLSDESAALVDKMLQDGPWESIDELFLNGLGTLQEDVEPIEDVDLEEIRRKLHMQLTRPAGLLPDDAPLELLDRASHQ